MFNIRLPQYGNGQNINLILEWSCMGKTEVKNECLKYCQLNNNSWQQLLIAFDVIVLNTHFAVLQVIDFASFEALWIIHK
jgi:hypothetical protein